MAIGLGLLLLSYSCTDELFGESYDSLNSTDTADGMAFSVCAEEQADLLYAVGRTRSAQDLPVLDSATVAVNTPTVTSFRGGGSGQQLYLHRQALPLVGIHQGTVGSGQASATRASVSDMVTEGSNPLNFHDSLSIWGCVYDPDYVPAVGDYGYDEECSGESYHRFLFSQTLLKKIRGWRSSVHWPYDEGHGKYMRFCVMAPAFESMDDIEMKSPPIYRHKLDADGNPVAGGEPSLTPPTFSYQVPSDPARQVDLLFGSSGDTPIDVMAGPTGDENYHLGEDDKIIPLTFRHILTAIRFAQGKMPTNVTITKIAILGVHEAGTYSAGSGQWSAQSGERSYELNTLFSVGSEENAWRGAENIYIDNGQVLFLLPQTLPTGAQIEITLEKAATAETPASTHTLTASIGGTEWPMGYTITYQISISELYDNYYLYIDPTKLEDSQTSEHANSNLDCSFTIHSYKNYTDITLKDDGQSANVHHAATWKVSGFSRDGQTAYEAKYRPEWLSKITGWETHASGSEAGVSDPQTPSGTGDNITVAYTLSSVKALPTYTANHATMLRNNSTGTSLNGIDLTRSVPDCRQSGMRKSLSPAESANSYVINCAGDNYQFPLVYGNALEKSDFNPDEIFKDHEGNTITQANILDQLRGTETTEDATSELTSEESAQNATGKTKHIQEGYFASIIRYDAYGTGTSESAENGKAFLKAELIWQDTPNKVFSDVRLTDNKDKINFDVSAENITPCNAVIALLGKKVRNEWYVLSGENLDDRYKNKPISSTITFVGGDDAPYDTLWTWHIWVTDEVYPNTGTGYEIAKQDGFKYINGNTYDKVQADDCAYINPVADDGTKDITLGNGSTIMPVNLGWVPDNLDWNKYEPREVWVEIEQVPTAADKEKYGITTPNKVHFKIRQEVYQDLITGTSPLYQWGRPTALPMLQKVNTSGTNSVTNKIYDIDGNVIQDVNSSNSAQHIFLRETAPSNHADDAIKLAISHPKSLVRKSTGTGNMLSNAKFDGRLWGNGTLAKKTIYDPCPPGYCVPASAVFSVFQLTRSDGTNTVDGAGGKVTNNSLNMWPNVVNANNETLRTGNQKAGGYFYIGEHDYKDGTDNADPAAGQHAANPWGIPASDRYNPVVYVPSTGKLAIRTTGSSGDDGVEKTMKMVHDTFSTGYFWCSGGSKDGNKNVSTSVLIRPQYVGDNTTYKVNNKDENNGNGYAIRPTK